MKGSEFQMIVEARAMAKTETRIRDCRDKIHEALREFFGGNSNTSSGWEYWDEGFREVMRILSSDKNKEDWPTEIMKEEIEMVTEDLLKTFDEFTRARLAADKSGKPEFQLRPETKPEEDTN